MTQDWNNVLVECKYGTMRLVSVKFMIRSLANRCILLVAGSALPFLVSVKMIESSMLLVFPKR